MSERIEKLRICNRKGIHTCRLGSIHLNEREAGILTEYLTQLEADRDEAVRRAVEEERNSIASLIESLKLSNCMPHEYKINPSAWQFAEGVVKKTKRELLKYLTPPTSDISSEGNSK